MASSHQEDAHQDHCSDSAANYYCRTSARTLWLPLLDARSASAATTTAGNFDVHAALFAFDSLTGPFVAEAVFLSTVGAHDWDGHDEYSMSETEWKRVWHLRARCVCETIPSHDGLSTVDVASRVSRTNSRPMSICGSDGEVGADIYLSWPKLRVWRAACREAAGS